MSETTAEIRAVEESALTWATMFEDLADGKDIVRWHSRFVQEMAPAALFGQKLGNGIEVGSVIDEGELTRLSFPCFLDSDPLPARQYAGPGTKVKFNGKWTQGAILITDRGLVEITDFGPMFGAVYVPLAHIREANELQFKFSMLSMTSAGPGYELIIEEEDGTKSRILFRVALTPSSKDGFDSALRKALSTG